MDIYEDLNHQASLAKLRQQLKVGIDQLAQDEGITVNSKAALDNLFDGIKR